ncbi:MAG: UDP-3-O-(3-hydroxymyristoyl)glucosamine N-acyltransferase [Bacteroidota bacterium]|nr:UDP-3-O-(3-hydroxymyristoyl)glucosamine N-acyltransferase [Bacteroidota bacterium]
MEFTAQTIADFLQGKVEGNPDAKVSDVSKIEEGRPGTLCFLANPKYEKYLYTTEATIVIVNNDQKLAEPVKATLVRVPNAYESFASLLELYNSFQPQRKGIEQPSSVASSVQMGEDVYIGAFSYISENVKLGNNVKIYPQCYVGDNVVIGDNTTIFAGARIYHNCKIGANCTIHSGVVIGADGFGFAPQSAENNYKKIPQIGNVVIEDYVEIGSNSTIDRATMGSTYIRKGVKLDNLIHIAHNVEVGENTVMAAQAGIAGSTKIGRDCMFGGQVGIAPHVTIANGVKLGARSGVNNSLKKENEVLIGAPVQPFTDFMKCSAIFRRLPDMKRDLDLLKKKLEDK